MTPLCPLCGGKGVMKAAPLQRVPLEMKSDELRAVGETHERAMWHQALTIPCWRCR